MDQEQPFARTDVVPSWFANALTRGLSVMSDGFKLVRLDATHLQIPAGANDQAAVIAIRGLWRWMEAPQTVAHPGGAAGLYPVFVTAKANNIVNVPLPFTDNTDYSFALTIKAPGATPTIVAGVVDVYRLVGHCEWDGAAITWIDQVVPLPPTPKDLLTKLPVSPYDGQVIDLLVDAAKGIIWRFRYRGGSASAFKWEAFGGQAPLFNEVLTPEGLTSVAYAVLATAGPALTLPILPTGGDFDVTLGCSISPGAGITGAMSYDIGGTGASDNDRVEATFGANGESANVVRTRRKLAIPGGTVLTAKYRGTGTTSNFANRYMSVTPVRVG